jgi:hypothetical protein
MMALWHERHKQGPAPIAWLRLPPADDGERRIGDEARTELFSTRRAIQGLIGRGYMKEAGTVISETPPSREGEPGRYYPKGYTRECKTYRLTSSGRAIALDVTRTELPDEAEG